MSNPKLVLLEIDDDGWSVESEDTDAPGRIKLRISLMPLKGKTYVVNCHLAHLPHGDRFYKHEFIVDVESSLLHKGSWIYGPK